MRHRKQRKQQSVRRESLEQRLERYKATADKPAPVKACYRYIHHLPGQFDY